jgi:hypothetical protein
MPDRVFQHGGLGDIMVGLADQTLTTSGTSICLVDFNGVHHDVSLKDFCTNFVTTLLNQLPMTFQGTTGTGNITRGLIQVLLIITSVETLDYPMTTRFVMILGITL